MKKFWFFGLIVLSLLVSACGTAAPTAAPAEPAVPQEEPTEAAALEPVALEPVAMDGKALLEDRCDICHPLMMIELSDYTNPKAWRGTVDDMVSRGAVLSDEENEVLVTYLMENYFKKGSAPAEGSGSAPATKPAAAVLPPAESPLNGVEKLGMTIFFDENLSINRNQSCATCHGPGVGFVGPDEEFNKHGAVYEGSIAGAFGNRKPPSAAYATFSPLLGMKDGAWFGGNFFDGRATGEKLGNPAADQAQGPFLNPKEQALAEGACVVYRICNGDYQDDFTQEYPGDCDITWPDDADDSCAAGELVALDDENRAKAEAAYNDIALALAAYEGSIVVNPFSSKFDLVQQGLTELSDGEKLGLELFQGRGQCTTCHPSVGEKPLLTDYSYHNLGVPANPENPVYAYDPTFVDPGLGGYLQSAGKEEAVYAAEWGKFKTATLRNVNLGSAENIVKAHMHNGFFKSLYGIVHFYNTRDILPECPGKYTEEQALAEKCWPAPEVAENADAEFMGDMGLTFEEEMALVAFLKTLDDGFVP